MKSYAPKSAPSMVDYQLRQAIKVEQVDPVLMKAGREIVAGNWPIDEVHERLVAQAQKPLEQQLNQQAEGLLLAVEANGMTAYAKGVQRLMSTWDDPVQFQAQVERLRVGFQVERQPEYGKALDRIEATYHRITELDDVVAAKLSYAIDTAVRQQPSDSDMVSRGTMGTTTEWRQDTDPKLASLLKINPKQAPRPTQLVHVMQARSSDGQQIPGKRYRSDKQSGWTEAVYNAPKSVSVAYGMAKTPEERKQILDAHRGAVHASLLEVEKTMGVMRYRDSEPAHITWVLFHHFTARATPGHPPDPHLHTHAYIPNVVLSRDGQHVGGLHGRAMHSKSAQVVDLPYKQALASELTRIGMDARYIPERHDIKLGHIPPELEQQFSKRAQQSTESARQFIAKRGKDYDALPVAVQQKAVRQAAQATHKASDGYREAKPGQIELKWQAQAETVGWKPKPGISKERLERSHSRAPSLRGWGVVGSAGYPVPRPEL